MTEASIEQVLHLVMWKAAPATILAAVAGLLLGYPRRWFARRESDEAEPTLDGGIEKDSDDGGPENGSGLEKVPQCPSCNSAMIKRRGLNASTNIWGCSRHPKCHGTRVF